MTISYPTATVKREFNRTFQGLLSRRAGRLLKKLLTRPEAVSGALPSGARAYEGEPRRQAEDFARRFFLIFVSSPRSSDSVRALHAGWLPEKVVFFGV